MTFRLYDTATREVRDFVPLEEGKAGIYVCGLTVQSEPHVGHVRSAVNFDVLGRWLTHLGYDVTLIRNVTDIDDKILAKSAEQGRPWFNLAYAMHAELTEALAGINVLPPTYEPGATGHVPEMLELIETLIARGHAYAAADGSGDVYFDVRSWPSYGELTGQKIDDMEAAEVAADPDSVARKRDPRDFALWKGWKQATEPASAAWPSPWGRGRPGWHIECSAMAGKYLGPAFDIHGGGVDLRFPHHENELAQSRAAGNEFASYWMHNAWITTAGEKMSKSLGNSLLVPKVLERVRGIELRFYMVSAHYRSRVEFSFEALEDAAVGFRRIEALLTEAGAIVGEPRSGVVPDAFSRAMNDDLGTPAAVAVVFDEVRAANRLRNAILHGNASPSQLVEFSDLVDGIYAMLDVLGLDPRDPGWRSDAKTSKSETKYKALVDQLIQYYMDDREQARQDRNFPLADKIRDQIQSIGISLVDTPAGPKWSLEDD